MRLRKAWLAGGAAFVALVIFLSLTPQPLQVPNVGPFKAGHVAAYTWLMLWFAQVYRGGVRAGIAMGLVLMGVGLEYLQDLTPHRTFSYWDMVNNAVGVAIGFALARTPLGGMVEKLQGK